MIFPKRGVPLTPRQRRDSLLHSTVENISSVPSYSKAPRGLFVLVQVGRIFTATSISPGKGSRQSLARSTFRAGRNLPDKGLRYHRTVIVTAAVHSGFDQQPLLAESLSVLTYEHWAGVSLYTLPFGFAETCVLVKQSASVINFDPAKGGARHLVNLRLAILPSSLSLHYPIALVVYYQPTCVGLRYGKITFHHENFLARKKSLNCFPYGKLFITTRLNVIADFPTITTLWLKSRSHIGTKLFSLSHPLVS